MRNQFADFLKRGRFVDTEGFSFKGDHCVAHAFLAEDGRLGVVVWNYSDKPEAVKVTAKERKLLGVYVPGSTEPLKDYESVSAESVCFYEWGKLN